MNGNIDLTGHVNCDKCVHGRVCISAGWQHTYCRNFQTVEDFQPHISIDSAANKVFETLIDGTINHGDTNTKCLKCGHELSVYYCENRLYAVKCEKCGTITLVRARNPEAAARAVGQDKNYVSIHRCRYQEPNRPLTLDEAMNEMRGEHKNCFAGYVEMKDEPGSDYAVYPALIHTFDGRLRAKVMDLPVSFFDNRYQGYGKTWRCWERIPTDEERQNAPWNDN